MRILKLRASDVISWKQALMMQITVGVAVALAGLGVQNSTPIM